MQNFVKNMFFKLYYPAPIVMLLLVSLYACLEIWTGLILADYQQFQYV